MREADEEIREIKKEIIESRGLIIKTNNLTNSLAADIKSIAKRQAAYERRFNWNSAIAYVLFATLSFVGLKLASDARISEIESDKSGLERQVRELRRELAEETRRAEERARAEAKAGQFYQLIRQQKREEVVDRYEALVQEKLSPAERAFFRDTVERFRLDLSIVAHQNGLDLMRTGRYAEAAEKFQESVRLGEDAGHIPEVKYHLARALRELGRQSEAMIFAREVTDQEVDKDLHDDAMWLVARCAEELGDLDTARD
ncbi:MAG: tetratricopeptide repeat protein, partial [Myxococcota bacterium]